MTKIIVAGSRGFNDYKTLENVLYKIIDKNNYEKVSIVSGKARGADTLGEQFAKNHNDVGIHEFPADWDKHGKSAGYIRNEEMAKFGDVLVAFWDSNSRGTMHMINLARKHNLTVFVYNYITRELQS